MIKTIPEDIFISFFIGQVFALSAAPMLEKEESMINTYFIRALLFQVLVFFPFGLFLAWRYTAWSWMYFINPHTHSKLYTLLAVFAYIPSMMAGFHIAYTLIRAGKKSQTYWYLVGSALGFYLFFGPLFGRLYHVQNDWVPVERIKEVPTWFNFWFMLAMTVWGAYFFAGIIYVMRLNRADRRRLAREAFSRPT